MQKLLSFIIAFYNNFDYRMHTCLLVSVNICLTLWLFCGNWCNESTRWRTLSRLFGFSLFLPALLSPFLYSISPLSSPIQHSRASGAPSKKRPGHLPLHFYLCLCSFLLLTLSLSAPSFTKKPRTGEHRKLFFNQGKCPRACMLSQSSCPALWDPMDCSSPGFSVQGILHGKYWSR